MIDFYKFYREYTARGVFSKPSSRMATPSVVAIVDRIRDSGTKSWLTDPMNSFKNLLTKKDEDRVNDCHDIERLHEIYPNKSPMEFAEAYIVYAISGLSVAVAEYLPMYILDSYGVTLAVNEKLIKIRKNVIRGKRSYRDNTRVPEEVIANLHKSLTILNNVCENNFWDNTPKTILEECVANVAVFINCFSAVYKISQEEFNIACQVHVVNDFKKYVIGD